ncbi:MAG: hypothetical protein AABX34_02275, partial [Nanoarchaeota archaeon]
KKNIIGIINKLNKNNKIGIILVTNLLSDIKYAENIVVMGKNCIIFNGKKSELSKKILEKAGLDA